jgi:hypothetical protein
MLEGSNRDGYALRYLDSNRRQHVVQSTEYVSVCPGEIGGRSVSDTAKLGTVDAAFGD